MNYDQPRQLEKGRSAGKWHYTRMNDRHIWPLGYCADAAREHYRQYQLDKQLRFIDPPEHPETLHRCQAGDCDQFTAGRAELHHLIAWPLCDEHRNRATVEKLYPTAGDSFGTG